MGSLSSSKSRQSSQQQSRSQSQQASQQASRSFSGSFVDPSQQGFLEQLRTDAQGLAGQQQGQIGGVAQGLADELGGFGGGFLQNLQNLSQNQGLTGLASQLGQGLDAGGQFLRDRISDQNPFLNEQITQLGTDLNRQFTESILPAIGLDAVSVGGLGGGRQGVAQGLAAQGLQQTFGRESAQLRFQDVGLRQAAAGQLQASQAAGGNLLGAAQGQQAAASQAGLGSLETLLNLGLSPFQAEFAPLQNLASILGPANILQQSQQASRGISSGFGTSFGSGSSSGRSSSFGIGVG